MSKLLVIVGPTASGKTKLAVELAKKYSGEIIAADSRTIYRSMNIGTAKPSLNEQKNVPHWGINLVDPGQKFTVADFQSYANAKICEITARGNLPILVGGSGLYVDSVVFNYEFAGQVSQNQRDFFEQKSIYDLQKYCKKNNIILPENSKNKRYLVNAILRKNVVKNNREKIRDKTLIIGLNPSKEILIKQIEKRINYMFNAGIEDETEFLMKRYSKNSEAMKSNIYRIVILLLNNKIDRKTAYRMAVLADWHLAKKQFTWFRRNKFIHWICSDDFAEAKNEAQNILENWIN